MLRLQARAWGKMATDPRGFLRASFDGLRNLNLAKVRQGIDLFGQQEGLLPQNVEAVKRALEYVSVAEFKQALQLCLAELARRVGTQRYALVIEHNLNSAKSSAWLAGQVVAALGRPAGYVTDEAGSIVRSLLRAKRRGKPIGYVVHVDDAMYSGLQKASILQRLAYYLDDLPPAEKKELGRFDVLVGAALTTPQALKAVRQGALQLRRHRIGVRVFAPRRLKHVRSTLPAATRKRLAAKYRSLAPTLALLPHKVPDYVSFGFGGLDEFLAKHLGSPAAAWKAPYKRTRVAVPQNVYYRNVLVRGKPTRVQFRVSTAATNKGPDVIVHEAREWNGRRRTWVRTRNSALLDKAAPVKPVTANDRGFYTEKNMFVNGRRQRVRFYESMREAPSGSLVTVLEARIYDAARRRWVSTVSTKLLNKVKVHPVPEWPARKQPLLSKFKAFWKWKKPKV